ncbi:MAG TPA: DUF305 domain-containing protein [Falsiroseomonas sp.]|jgi:uncharacterized protein (DUF305 family)|nr:DUF305 domain-containing protein [Falsiroseomonas sp.]
MTRLALAAILAFSIAAPAFAQHAGHGVPRAAAAEPASTREYRAINERMHREMAVQFTGDPDRDFAAAMIPHHRGAIDMARVALRHGRDAEIRKLAEDVIRAQESEIAQLRAFLARTAPR